MGLGLWGGRDRVSLCSFGHPATHSADQANLPFAPQVLGLKAYTAPPFSHNLSSYSQNVHSGLGTQQSIVLNFFRGPYLWCCHLAEAGGSEFKVVCGYMRLSQNNQKFPQKLAHIHIPKGPLAEGSHGEILFFRRCAGYNICTSEASVSCKPQSSWGLD